MKKKDKEFENTMRTLVKKYKLEQDAVLKKIYWMNKSQRSTFQASRQRVDINFHAVKYTTDPLELTMSVKDMIMLLKQSKYLTDSEEEDILIDIVERFMDHEASYKTARDEYLVKRPILLELQEGSSIDLNSTLNGDEMSIGHDFGSGTQGSPQKLLKNNLSKDSKEANSILEGQIPHALNINTDGDINAQKQSLTSVDPRSPTNRLDLKEKASTVIESNDQFKQFQLQDKKGLVGNQNREIPFTEKQFRKEHFDRELAIAKNRALGGEILMFEFVQTLILFLLKTVIQLTNFNF